MRSSSWRFPPVLAVLSVHPRGRVRCHARLAGAHALGTYLLRCGACRKRGEGVHRCSHHAILARK